MLSSSVPHKIEKYKIHETGFGHIQINSNLADSNLFEQVCINNYKEYLFQPNCYNFLSLNDLAASEFSIPFKVEKVFVASDDNKVIRKIFIFLSGSQESLEVYFDSLFSVDAVKGISLRVDSINRCFFWNTNSKTTVTLFNMNFFNEEPNLFMLEFRNVADDEFIKKRVIKLPNLKG